MVNYFACLTKLLLAASNEIKISYLNYALLTHKASVELFFFKLINSNTVVTTKIKLDSSQLCDMFNSKIFSQPTRNSLSCLLNQFYENYVLVYINYPGMYHESSEADCGGVCLAAVMGAQKQRCGDIYVFCHTTLYVLYNTNNTQVNWSGRIFHSQLVRW